MLPSVLHKSLHLLILFNFNFLYNDPNNGYWIIKYSILLQEKWEYYTQHIKQTSCLQEQWDSPIELRERSSSAHKKKHTYDSQFHHWNHCTQKPHYTFLDFHPIGRVQNHTGIHCSLKQAVPCTLSGNGTNWNREVGEYYSEVSNTLFTDTNILFSSHTFYTSRLNMYKYKGYSPL